MLNYTLCYILVYAVCVCVGRYIGVDTGGELVGKAEAVGLREQWEPVFQEVNKTVTFKPEELLSLC